MRKEVSKYDLSYLTVKEKKEVGKAFCDYLDVLATANNRETAYNTKQQIEKKTQEIHDKLFKIDRSLYGLSLLFPGVLDNSKNIGMNNLLENPRGDAATLLTPEQERELIILLTSDMPVPRVLKTYMQFKKNGINNARTRKLVLRYILSRRSIDYVSIKYRSKVKTVLTHVWGQRTASIIGSILSKKRRTNKEKDILKDNIDRYVPANGDISAVYEAVHFALVGNGDYQSGLLKSYREAKIDLSKGANLPSEVLEGIRSTYHPSVSKDKVLELTSHTMTEKTKMRSQKRLKKAGVKETFDASKQTASDLYVYAFEMGMNKEIQDTLEAKAVKGSGSFSNYEKIGILVDVSASMAGRDSQKNRPIASALALRDSLSKTAKHVEYAYSNGSEAKAFELVTPSGETSLASGLMDLLMKNVEVVFIITDGYENAPSGRVNQVMTMVRDVGNTTPVYQLNPVMSSEASGIKEVSKHVIAMPFSNPEAMAISHIKGMLEIDVDKGLEALLNYTMPKLLEA